MRLVDMERDIKTTLAEKGMSDPEELFNKIYQLLFVYLQHRKLLSSADEAAEVAQIGAEELYMKLYSGQEIHSWLGYISRSCHGYIRGWRYINGSEIIDSAEDPLLGEAIIGMCTSFNRGDDREHQKIFDFSYIESIPNVIDSVMENSRYVEFTTEYLNARLSLFLSLQCSKYISYHQTEDNKMYTRMLYNKLKEKVSKSISETALQDINSGGLTLLQLFAISNADIEYND